MGSFSASSANMSRNQEISGPAGSISISTIDYLIPIPAHMPITSSDVVPGSLAVAAKRVALRSDILATSAFSASCALRPSCFWMLKVGWSIRR